jgi:hypothetical protein
MLRVACIRIDGLALWFISGDHMPPHFHVEKAGEWEIKVQFLMDDDEMFEIVWTAHEGRPSRRDLRELLAAVRERRPGLLQEWHEKVNVGRSGEGEDP